MKINLFIIILFLKFSYSLNNYNIKDLTINEQYHCPICNRTFSIWNSCMNHINIRKHNKIRSSCLFNESILPSCETHYNIKEMENLKFGSCDLQGLRNSMEDVNIATHINGQIKYDLFGVYDGHYGKTAALLLASTLHKVLFYLLYRHYLQYYFNHIIFHMLLKKLF